MTTPTPHLSHPKYRPDIDGLRAVAVLSVVAFHAFPAWMKGGFIGVDVFFVISGFLISTIIFENLDRGTFSFAEFYARRIKRIFPAVLLVLIASFAFGWFALLADEYKQLGKHIAAGAGFVSNLVLWSEAGYFDNSAETKPLLHLWSLGIEEQFYIVWPFVLWFALKRKFNLLTLTVIVALISFSLNLKGIKQDSVATFYSPQTRFWELLSGSLLAWFAIYKKGAFHAYTLKIDGWLSNVIFREPVEADGMTLSNAISFFGSLLLMFGFWRITKDVSFPGKWAVIPILGAILIILAGPKAWINRKILSNKIAVWFGLISFPLYLWHWPLLSFVRIVESEVPNHTIRISAVVLSIFLAWLTYKFVERPIRLGGRKIFKVTLLVILMALIGYVGYNAYSREGLKFRSVVIAQKENSIAFEWPADRNKNEACLRELGSLKSSYCVASDDYPLRIALIGDSHANAIFEFLKKYFSERGSGVIQLGQGGCPPFLNVERDQENCPLIMNDTVSYIERNSNITDVYITGRFAATLSGVDFGGDTPVNFYSIKSLEMPNVKERDKIFNTGLRSIVDRLTKANKRVTILLDLPELNFDPKSCLKSSLTNQCRINKNLVMERQSPYREIVLKVASDFNSKVVDLMNAFCDANYCYAKQNGKILYRDHHHLGVWGTEYLLDVKFKID